MSDPKEPTVQRRLQTRLVGLALYLALSAPSQAGEIVPLTGDVYMLVRDSKAGIFANMAKLKTATIREANAFAEQQGKVAVPVFMQENPAGGPGQWPSFEYQFRLVDKGSEAAQTPGALTPRADVVIESSQKVSADVSTTDSRPQPAPQRDVYSELMKLDDLRKKGILTDAEFEAEKAKVLARP